MSVAPGGWPDPSPELLATVERRLRRYVAPALDGPPYSIKPWQGFGLMLVLGPLLDHVEQLAPAASSFVASLTPAAGRVAVDAGTVPRLLELEAAPPHEELARVAWFAGVAFGWNVAELACRAWAITVEAGGGGFLMTGAPALRARRRRAGDREERQAAMTAAGVRDMLDPGRRLIPLSGALVRGGVQYVRSGRARDQRRPWRYFDEDLGTPANGTPWSFEEITATIPAPTTDAGRADLGITPEDLAGLLAALPRQQRRFVEALPGRTAAAAARQLGLTPAAGRQLFRRIVAGAGRRK